MELTPGLIEILLVIVSVVAIVTRRLRMPYTVGLVITGWVLASRSIAPNVHLTKELVYGALLPPLIFEAAFHLKWRELRPLLPVTMLLATIGVLAAAAVSACILYCFAGISWQAALIIGVVLSATDPVSVLALLKEANLPSKVRLLVESESLFNDGTTAVLFMLSLSIIAGGGGVGEITALTLVGIGGGIFIGAVFGGFGLLLAGRTEDHLVEIATTMVVAFGSFMVAEHFHASGVLSTLVAGMILGNLGHFGAITQKGHEATVSFWEYIGFVSNSFIFLLIGFDLPAQHLSGILPIVAWTIFASLLGRAVAVYPGCFVFRATEIAVPAALQHLLVWGGLRGALALALVLGLAPDFPDRQTVVVSVFYAVAFSILIQGLTVSPFVRRAGASS